jgi:hypothetical protein
MDIHARAMILGSSVDFVGHCFANAKIDLKRIGPQVSVLSVPPCFKKISSVVFEVMGSIPNLRFEDQWHTAGVLD